MGIEETSSGYIGKAMITHFLLESWEGMVTRDMDIHINNLHLECDMCDKSGHKVMLTFDTNFERYYGMNICKTCLDSAIEKELQDYEEFPHADQKVANAKNIQDFNKSCDFIITKSKPT